MNKILMSLAILTVSCFNMFAQTSSFISDCDNFVDGPNENWPYVLVATTVSDSSESQGSQTFSINISSLPEGGANFRIYKTTANGNDYFGNPIALSLGENTITVSAVNFDRAVKFQFSSGDIEFDALSLNGEDTDCVTNNSSIGLESINTKYEIKLFPNPTINNIVISLKGIDCVMIDVIDIQGKVLSHESRVFNKDLINLSSYQSGIYFVKIITPDGSKQIRVIKL